MPTVHLLVLALLIAGVLWLLALLVLAAHRLRPLLGLSPLLILLGVIAGVLEYPLFSYIQVQVGSQELSLQIVSFMFLPALLLGLLTIYIVEGTIHARTVLLGILAATVLAATINILSSLEQTWSQGALNTSLVWTSLRQLVASLLALTADMYFLVVIYQWVSNIRKRHPSGVAVLVAFLVALWCDALVFATIYFIGTPGAWHKLLLHLLGKTFAGLILAPLAAIYVKNYARLFPNDLVTAPRPVLDIFTTSQQFEARARYSYNLLQTLLKINHLVVRATNLQTLLDQACQLLAGNQEYVLVCIHLTGKKPLTARAGKKHDLSDACMVDENGFLIPATPAHTALNDQKVLVINQVGDHLPDAIWAQKASQLGIGSIACFPILHEQQPLGVMMVAAVHEQVFDVEEVDLLHDLVGDLANAITNFQLRQEQATLITAAEMMPDGLLITDLSGNILYSNAIVAQDLRVGEKDLLGQNITTFLHIDTRRQMVDSYIQTLRQTGSLEIDYELELPDGRTYPLSIRAALVYDPQHKPRQIVISIRDISSYKQNEHRLLTLNQLTTDLVQHLTRDELLPVVFAAAEELLGAQSSALYLSGSDDQTIEFITHNLSDVYAQRIAQSYHGLPGETVLQTHKPVYVNDVLNDPIYQERIHFMADYGVHALLLLPILFEDRLSGVLVVYHNQPHNFSEEEVQLGMTLAHTVAIALQNLHLYQAEHSQRQLAETLAQAAANLNRLLDPDQVLDQILEQTLQLTSCNSANIMLIEGNKVRLARRIGYDEAPIYPTEYEDFSLPLTAPTIQAMFESGEPLLISNTLQDERWTPVSRTEWIRSFAGIPLKVSGQVVGFLNVDSDQPNAFNLDTTRRLQALADHASIAIHNAELYSESNRQAQELSTLVQSAATVTGSLDSNQVLELLSQQMARLAGVQGCAISVYDQSNFTVSFLAYYIEPPISRKESWQEPFSLYDYPLTRRVLQEHIVVQLHADDPLADPAEVSLMQEAGVKTLLMLPLVVREETLGLVELETVDPGRVFTQREIALLQTLGANAANALQNARLYSQLQEYATMLERRVEERTIELRSAKEHIESILASIPDALFVLDDNYQPIRANQAGEELILLALTEKLNLFEPELLDGLRSGRLQPEEAILQAKGRSYQALASPFPVQPGQQGLVVVFRDVTRFRELDEIKTHFVSDVSHELRTPLTNLMLYLDLLAALDDPRKGTSYITTLQRETKRLGFLIEDLLTISRLEAGRVNISIKPVDVNSLV
ncbi:MAG: GAF domain-containing protein, partial [Anaerolineales bacterium]|nr:GAF domain-containing protein [Anaerolineales bacterium]